MTCDTKLRATIFAAGVFSVGATEVFAAAESGESPSIFTGDLGNVIWTLVTFVAVVIVLGKFAWGPVLTALQKREAFIRNSLAEAKKGQEQAEARLRQIEERLAAAHQEAGAIVDEGRRDAEEVKRRIQQETRRESDEMLERATREIGLARDTAVKELYGLTATLATEAASRVVGKEINAADHERLIAEAIAEVAKGNGKGTA